MAAQKCVGGVTWVLGGAAVSCLGLKLKSFVPWLEPDFAVPTNSQATKLELQDAASIVNGCGVIQSAEMDVTSRYMEQALLVPKLFARKQPEQRFQLGAVQMFSWHHQ
mmetsp:Transcript_86130/g.172463  ORF Transcript_86130/g.172463 Transcript_86130/m.172463 type:complete len:108 (+) Transcript_86130:90-413(+)